MTFKKQKMELNSDALAAGVKDGLSGVQPLLTEDEVRQVMMTFSKEMTEKTAMANKEAGEKNKAEGEKFLRENKNKPGVKTTASGLQYKALKEGTGPQPKAADTVTVDYRGTLRLSTGKASARRVRTSMPPASRCKWASPPTGSRTGGSARSIATIAVSRSAAWNISTR